MARNEAAAHIVHGIGASPGIAIGRAQRLGEPGRAIRRRDLAAEEVEPEILRFRAAVEQTRNELLAARDELENRELAAIIDSHLLILQDGMVANRTVEIVDEQQVNAEWALKQALEKARAAFALLDDPYIRSRFQDVEQVTERLMGLLSGGEADGLPAGKGRVIIVSRDFSPVHATRMRRDRILGFMTDMGGKTSHSAIVARALGIPAVVGLETISQTVSTGDMVILDGITGKVYINPTPDQVQCYLEYERQYQQYSAEVEAFAHLPAETRDGLKVRVMANIEMVEAVSSALEYGAAGIGLYRSEYLYIGCNSWPSEEQLFTVYRDLLTLMAPFPVTIRTLDVGGDKLAPYCEHIREMNPALGVRAIRFSLYEQDAFRVQLRALFRASVFGNLRIMFPMVSDVREIMMVKEIIAQVRDELRASGLPFQEVPIGIMIEVPSAVALADILAKEVDFFSIGTNDLIQYALAIDRGNEHVAHMYEPVHPAVLRMIKHVVDAGHDNGIEVGVCGEMAGDAAYLPTLLGLGFDELSMNPLAIACIKRMIRHSTAEDVERLAAELLTLSTVEEVRQRLTEYLPAAYPHEFGETSPIHRGPATAPLGSLI